MSEYLVSICIPTYEQIDSLKRCLDSILIQNFRNFEIIITDDSRSNIIEDFIAKYNFEDITYKYIKNLKQLGSPENWNEGIRHSKAKFIKVLHHDDWFTYKNSLETFIKAIENEPNISLAFVCSRNINLKDFSIININRPSISYTNTIKNNPILLVSGNFIGSPSATIFTRLDNYTYFDKNLKWYVDTEAYTNLLSKYKAKLIFNDSDAISVGISEHQITRECENNPQINIFEFFYYLEKHNFKYLNNFDITLSCLEHFRNFSIDSIKKIRIYFDGRLPIGVRLLAFSMKFIGYNYTYKLISKIFS